MNRRHFSRMALLLCTSSMAWAGAGMAAAADEAPDAMVQRLSNEVLETLRTDKTIRSGNINRIIALVDKVIMPHVNFRRMMAAAVGPAWRKATPEQRPIKNCKTEAANSHKSAVSEFMDRKVLTV